VRGLSRQRAIAVRSLAALAALNTACGGSTAPSTPTATDNPNQMVISAAGVLTPSEITVTAGSRVLFINNHAQPHQIASDPHPDHTDCPEINQVGVLAPGQRRETGNLVTVRTCGLHDHLNPDNASLHGRIIIHP
jgi:plastocyanin